ncbi:hypothetical protein Tco_1380219, partial [Tanacetum coccineum]
GIVGDLEVIGFLLLAFTGIILCRCATMDTDNVVSSVAGVTIVWKMVSNDVNMDTVNMETTLESKKGADVNSNANAEPTASTSLSASVSFAALLKGDTSQKSVNFRTLNTPARNEADVVVPLKSI